MTFGINASHDTSFLVSRCFLSSLPPAINFPPNFGTTFRAPSIVLAKIRVCAYIRHSRSDTTPRRSTVRFTAAHGRDEEDAGVESVAMKLKCNFARCSAANLRELGIRVSDFPRAGSHRDGDRKGCRARPVHPTCFNPTTNDKPRHRVG